MHSYSLAVAAVFLAGGSAAVATEDVAATIKRQSQEFSDASATGDAKLFEKYLDDSVIFMDESGSITTKRELVEGASPPAKDITNHLEQSDFDVKLHGNVAVNSFTDNSTVSFFGQSLKARYRSTEVWLKEKDGWKMISSQTLALPDDPPAMQICVHELDEYVGTYSAAPGYVVKIERDGESLVSATNGGKSSPLRVEVRDMLFTPGLPRLRRVFERDATGKIVGFSSRREGHDLHFKRDP
jgi:ketosteroid isomerase-like protein